MGKLHSRQNPLEVLIKNIACQLRSDKQGVKYLKKSRTKFQEKSRKNQKLKSQKNKKPIKTKSDITEKTKKNKNKTKSPTNFSEYFTPRGLISFHLFVREDIT